MQDLKSAIDAVASNYTWNIEQGLTPIMPGEGSSLIGEAIKLDENINDLFNNFSMLDDGAKDALIAATEGVSNILVLLGLPPTCFRKPA